MGTRVVIRVFLSDLEEAANVSTCLCIAFEGVCRLYELLLLGATLHPLIINII
jgi:hypothetical protein